MIVRGFESPSPLQNTLFKMTDTISYKINNAYMLPYAIAIDENKMQQAEENNEIISSSRVYLICRIQKKGIIFKSLSKPEVLYVGETFNKKKRFSPHKKLLKATTLINPKDELVVFFLHMRFSFFGISLFQNNPVDIFNDIKDLYSKTSVKLVERFFIKLFRPILNEKNNDEKIRDDKLIVKKLIDNSIEFVTLDVGMNDHLFNFVGGNRIEKVDWYTFNLNTEEITYGHPALESNYC